MKILEFGDSSKKKLVLIHGFQCPVSIWDEYITYFQKDYHVIVPVITGHNPEEPEDFVSFEETARELEDMILSHWGENVYAVYGMSMGGVLIATLWKNKRLHMEKILFDGSPLVSFSGFLGELMNHFQLKFYLDVTHKSQQRDKKTLKQATKGIMPKDKMEDFLQVLDHMSDTTIANCLLAVQKFKMSSNLDVQNTKVYYFHGTAVNEILARKSAKYLQKHYSDVFVKCFPGKSHCELALFHPGEMIKELEHALS